MKFLKLLPCVFAVAAQAAVSDYSIEATKKPIAFSVVREDSDQDLNLVRHYFPEDKVSMLMIASGGCTAAYLAAKAPIADLTIVDPNPSQIALTKLKMQLLSLPTQKRLELLGYLPMASAKRKVVMQGYLQALNLDQNALGDLDLIAEYGVDYEGRYEKVFEELRKELDSSKVDLDKLFAFTDVKEQASFVEPGTEFGDKLDAALDKVMSQENLVKIFGEKATANRVQEFSRHFAQRVRVYLNSHLASSSAWLANMLLGKFHDNVMYPWLTTDCSAPLPKLDYQHGFMNDILEKSDAERYHVIHLSNIIDWLTPEEATKTLQLAHRALKPGGVVIIRQLNSNVNIPKLGGQFSWDTKLQKEYLEEDRSFFYRNIFVGCQHKESLAPQVKALADETLKQIPVIEGSFFKDLPTMDKKLFQDVQAQFFFAVNYFSRPMAAIVSRLPMHKDRIDIIHNIVEEHGNFSVADYHSTSFKKFLSTIGVSEDDMQKLSPSAPVNMFNYTLMGACSAEDPVVAIACNGIIEYAFADISALIADHVVKQGWVNKKDLVHYNLHADIDKEHAEEFFKIVEPYMGSAEGEARVAAGLQLGAYIFNRLYEDLYKNAKVKLQK